MKSSVRRTIVSLCLILLPLAGCADDEVAASAAPYQSGQTVIVGGGDGGEVTDTPSGDDCIDLNDACVKPQETCGEDARADIIVDADGNHVKTVCYPGGDAATFDQIEGSAKPEGDGVVYELDDKDDGEDITNNVEFKGNESVLYGHGPDVSVVGGNLKVVGNDAVVRGVHIKGNVDLEGNDGLLTLCVIEGNLHVKGTGNVITECVIHGDVKVDTSSASMVSNLVQKGWDVADESVTCSGNRSFTDTNENGRLDDGEEGESLTCPSD